MTDHSGVDVRASRALSVNDNQGDKSESEGEREGEGEDNEQGKELMTEPQKTGISEYECQKQKNVSELKVIMNRIKDEMGYATLVKDIRKDVDKVKGKGKGKGKAKTAKESVSNGEPRKSARLSETM